MTLHEHAIFDQSNTKLTELSPASLTTFINSDSDEDQSSVSGRRQTMLLKDNDLIVAVGHEIRLTSLSSAKFSSKEEQNYKVLYTPNIEFDIHQVALSPTGKLLAVAGAFQVAVVTLPAEYTRLVSKTVDCKSLQVGKYLHGVDTSPPIAKIEWHPWGLGGSTLLVMTVDGKLREYDVSEDPDQPQQVLSFVSDKRGKSYLAQDPAEREVASFALGTGRGDWGPLTVYALMKSGDIYSICPYLPQNAYVPSSYVQSLECFISAKQEFLSQSNSSTASRNLSTVYEHQYKYVSALLKQLPTGTVFPSISRSVVIHPPSTIKSQPARQGPFLLQPSPLNLPGSDGGDATDIVYLTFGTSDDSGDESSSTERLGVILVSYQDGRVDLCLDVEKVEARWESKQHVLPMLAVYETIDLDLVNTLSSLSSVRGEPSPLSLLQANYPVFLPDPVLDDTVYVYHAFGVHALNLGPVLRPLADALCSEEGTSLDRTLTEPQNTTVKHILSTFSVQRRSSNPVVSVAVPDDMYINYSIYILTATMRLVSFTLNPRTESLRSSTGSKSSTEPGKESKFLAPLPGPPAYVSLLSDKPFIPHPILTSRSGLPPHPVLSLPKSQPLMLTPDTMRYLTATVTHLSRQIEEIQLASKLTEGRASLQAQELCRLCQKCQEMVIIVGTLRGAKRSSNEARLRKIQETQTGLQVRLDRVLQFMIEKASPELSEGEAKWFEELRRMKDDVVGVGKYDERSLKARIRTLEKEYTRILPSLKAFIEKENQRRQKNAITTNTLGLSQASELADRSDERKVKLANIEQEISKLASKLDVTLGIAS